jgi:acyl carrier protein
MFGTKEQISNDVKKILVEDLFVDIPLEEIKDTDSLGADIGLDSVAHIELFSIIEDRYGIKVDTGQESLENYRTIQSMTDYIWNNLQAVGKA